MKKYVSCAIALLSLVACQKESFKESIPSEGNTFDIIADITKTTINGKDVNWEEGDILYLVTSDETWGKPYTNDKEAATIAEYTYGSGVFKSTATIANGDYTFRALYSNGSQKSYHRGASTTFSLSSTQVQDCSNPTAHLKVNDAMVGRFTASIPMDIPAAVNMSHIFTIMKVDVMNNTGAAVELKKFEMSATGANLSGIFTVNFDNSPIDITEKTGYGETITVNLSNGTVASGASIPVYFVMAPLKNYSGDVTFTVTDSNDMVYSKTLSLSGLTFNAGSLNTTQYAISTGVAPTSYDWDLSVDSTSEATEDQIGWTNSVADMLCVRKDDKATPANNYYPGANERTSTRFYANSTLTITPKAGKSLTYYVFTATTLDYANTLANSTWTNASAIVSDAANKIVTVVAIDPAQVVSAVIGGTCGFTKVECHTDSAPTFIKTTTTSIDASATGGNHTIEYSIFNPTGNAISASSDQPWVHSFVYPEDGKISFTIDANTGEERSATITLSYEGAENVTVSLNQGAAGAPIVLYTLDTTGDLKGTNNSYAGNCDVESGGITWNVTGNSKTNPWRIGGKSITKTDRTVYSKTAFSKALTSVNVSFGDASSITVNSCKIVYSNNSDFSDSKEVSGSFAAGSTVEFAADYPANCYYKLVLNVTVSDTKSNRYVQLKKIEFVGHE